jgi:CRISPR type IV-associated protein Csf3
MKPFKVTFTINGEVAVPSHLIHLDDLLAWASVDAARKSGMDNPIAAKDDLPLAVHDGDSGWCWKASALRFHVLSESRLLCRTRRVDYETIARKKDDLIDFRMTKFTEGTGPYKGFDVRDAVQWIDTATAFGVGHIAKVQELLSRIHCIGSLRKLGFGRVRSFDVSPCGDEDAWMYRHLPESSAGHVPVVGGLSPPYWDRTRHRTVYEPILEVHYA